MNATEAQKTSRKRNIGAQVENRIFIFCVTFLYFGPYFVDIGHDFVDSIKNWLRVS